MYSLEIISYITDFVKSLLANLGNISWMQVSIIEDFPKGIYDMGVLESINGDGPTITIPHIPWWLPPLSGIAWILLNYDPEEDPDQLRIHLILVPILIQGRVHVCAIDSLDQSGASLTVLYMSFSGGSLPNLTWRNINFRGVPFKSLSHNPNPSNRFFDEDEFRRLLHNSLNENPFTALNRRSFCRYKFPAPHPYAWYGLRDELNLEITTTNIDRSIVTIQPPFDGQIAEYNFIYIELLDYNAFPFSTIFD